MKRGFLNLFALYLMGAIFADNKGQITTMPRVVNSGLSGWTGFTGTNANKKKHFNKRKHGFYLKKSRR